MPTTTEILSGLEAIANDAIWFAVASHALVGALLVALRLGWRPTGVLAAALLWPLPAAVSALAATHGNPFNAATFGALTLVLLGAGFRLGRTRLSAGPAWGLWIGAALIAYAWVYPHFLSSRSPALYLVASPLGLIPCPTLAALTGLTMLARPGASTTWTVTLGLFGLFYGLFGMLRLGVWLDAGLLVGAAVLLGSLIKSDLG